MQSQAMEPFALLLIFLIAFCLLLLKKKLEGNRAVKKLPPGPWRLPIIGNLHQVGSMPHRSFLRLSQKHGPLMFLHLGSIPTIVVSSGEALESIFKSHDVIFSGRPVLKTATKLSFNNSNISFAQYGENWRQARKLSVLEVLSPRRVRSFQSVREQEMAMLSAAITDLSSSNSSLINLSEMVFALSYNVLCRAVFGDQLGGGAGVYQGRRSWFHHFHGVMAETQNLVAGFCAADLFPGCDWIDGILGQREKLEKNFAKINRFYEMVIEEHLKSGKEKETDDKEDLVDVLLRLHKEAPDGGFLSTMNYVKGIMGDMFFAGIDTSSATIIWTMTELMKNPRVMSELLQELQDAIANKNKVEESELQQLQYLRLVIKESLRLHPPAPLLVPRETLESCSIDGYDIPAKTRVFINAAAIATDPKTWKNPSEFWPERFASTGASDLKGQDFNYVPFGVGRRSCPGVDFAAVLVELVLANLLHCFEWSLPDGMKPEDIDMGEASGLTIHKRVPLCMIAKPKMR